MIAFAVDKASFATVLTTM